MARSCSRHSSGFRLLVRESIPENNQPHPSHAELSRPLERHCWVFPPIGALRLEGPVTYKGCARKCCEILFCASGSCRPEKKTSPGGVVCRVGYFLLSPRIFLMASTAATTVGTTRARRAVTTQTANGTIPKNSAEDSHSTNGAHYPQALGFALRQDLTRLKVVITRRGLVALHVVAAVGAMRNFLG